MGKIDGFYDGAVMYDYERIAMFRDQGYSREAIIDWYAGPRITREEAEYLIDQCLLGKKLTYEYVNGVIMLVEHQ
jgi:hypothetical protein